MNNAEIGLLVVAVADIFFGIIPEWFLLAVCLAGLLVFSVLWTDAGGR